MILPNHYKKLALSSMQIPLVLSTNKDFQKVENVLDKEFPSLCQWFIDNKLPIYFG